jgi:hypothetical protein
MAERKYAEEAWAREFKFSLDMFVSVLAFLSARGCGPFRLVAWTMQVRTRRGSKKSSVVEVELDDEPAQRERPRDLPPKDYPSGSRI